MWSSIDQVHWTFHWSLCSLYIKALRSSVKVEPGRRKCHHRRGFRSCPREDLGCSNGCWKHLITTSPALVFVRVLFFHCWTLAASTIFLGGCKESLQELVWESSCWRHLKMSAPVCSCRLYCPVIGSDWQVSLAPDRTVGCLARNLLWCF